MMGDRAMRGKGPAVDATAAAAAPPQVDIRALVVQHHAGVYRYAYRLCGNQADAEDLAQQTFLVAHERLAQLREPERAAAWLFAILRSCYWKSKRKQRPIDATGLELDVDQLPDSVDEADIDREQLQRAMDELPDEFKLVLVMFYFQGCSYKEIASGLDVPIGTVMSRLARAKSRLRGRLLPRATEGEDPLARRPLSGERDAPAFAARGRKHSHRVGR